MATTQAPFQPVETTDADRVRAHTDDDRLAELDQQARARIQALRDASDAQLTARIAELEEESDIERVLEINASSLALTGLALGVFVNRRLLAIPAVVLAFLLQHGIQGWCPPVPVLRKLGIRTRQEIDAEKYATQSDARRLRLTPLIPGTPCQRRRNHPDFVLAEMHVPQSFIGVNLGDSALRRQHHITVVCVKPRGGQFTYATAETVLNSDDLIVIAGHRAHVDDFVEGA